jgi:nicotinamide-nucleotide amidase
VTVDRWPDRDLASLCVERLVARAETVATAESLTAGLICAVLADVAGASAALRGGAATYATDAKAEVLNVPTGVLTEYGAVSEQCAVAMAEGARALFAATWGISATGVAGPETQEGHPVGTVFVGVAGPAGSRVVELALAGERNEIRTQSAEAALQLLLTVLPTDSHDGESPSRSATEGAGG